MTESLVGVTSNQLNDGNDNAPTSKTAPQHSPESSYKQTQNEIYKFQETLLNSIKEKNNDSRSNTIDTNTSTRAAEEDSDFLQSKEKTNERSPVQSSVTDNNDTLSKPSDSLSFPYVSSKTAQSTINGTTLSSFKVFEYVKKHYNENIGKVIGVMKYHPYKEGTLIQKPTVQVSTNAGEVDVCHVIDNRIPENTYDIGTKYNDYVLTSQVSPFIPNLDSLLQTREMENDFCSVIGKIMQVYIPHDAYFTEYVDYPRFANNEIWGYDIYTDDSDVLLILKQQELKKSQVFNGFNTLKYRETGESFFSNKHSTSNGQEHSFDILAQFVILPTLENYYGDLAQNDIFSRPWYGTQFNSSHDGYSIALYDAEPVYV